MQGTLKTVAIDPVHPNLVLNQTNQSNVSKHPRIPATENNLNSISDSNAASRHTIFNYHVVNVNSNRQGHVLPSPVNKGKLLEYLEGYDKGLFQFLAKGFSEGFRLQFHGERESRRAQNLKSATERPEIVKEKLIKELNAGRMVGPFEAAPFPAFRCSPIGLQPKEDGNFRLIHHLSRLHGDPFNSGIPSEYTSVQYHTVSLAIASIKKIGKPCFLAKTDIKSAFRKIPVHPSDYDLLGFEWEGGFYYDHCLPMGCSASCSIFEAFSSALQYAATRHMCNVEMLHVLDDFLFISSSFEACKEGLVTFLEMCKDIGVPIAHEKTEGPLVVMTFLGIEVDTIKSETRLPYDKLVKGISLVSEMKVRNKVTLRELQSLVGFLNFTTSAILPGKPFLRKFINLMKGLKKPFYRARLTSEVKSDLEMWQEFLESYNGASFFIEENWVEASKLHLFTDASSTLGFGLILGSSWVYDSWPEELPELCISVLEMYPIALALLLFSEVLKGKSIIIHTDNEALVHVFNNKSSKDSHILSMLHRIILVGLQYNIRIRAVHIPGYLNTHADALSRLEVSKFKTTAPWADPQPTSIPQHLSPLSLLKV